MPSALRIRAKPLAALIFMGSPPRGPDCAARPRYVAPETFSRTSARRNIGWRGARGDAATLDTRGIRESMNGAPDTSSQAAQKGPAARRRPMAAREAYSLYGERA